MLSSNLKSYSDNTGLYAERNNLNQYTKMLIMAEYNFFLYFSIFSPFYITSLIYVVSILHRLFYNFKKTNLVMFKSDRFIVKKNDF